MKSKWVIHKLNSHRSSSSLASLLFPHKTQLQQSSASKVPSSILAAVDVSLVLSLCGREANLHLGSSIHASMIKTIDLSSQSLVISNSLLSMYCKCRVLDNAVKVFDEMPLRDTISWNSLISGFLTAGEFESGLRWFKRMLNSGIYRFDQATLTTILSACDGDDELGCNVNRMIHGLVFLSGFDNDISVGNALITSYFKCGSFHSGKLVFDEMVERNVISWTAAISGLSQNELYEDSLTLVVEMLREGTTEPNFLTYLSGLTACSGLQAAREGSQIHGHVWKLGFQSELCIESALMDMYSKCGNVEDAWRVFDSAAQIDEVSMTVILVGFAQNGFEEEAIQFFAKMVKAGVEIDANMVSAVLAASSSSSCSSLGEQIHSMIVKRRVDSNVFVCNGLINMYSKCGNLAESTKIFKDCNKKNSVSWNSMIAAFARHGDFSTAMQLYDEMRNERVEPTDVTFLSLLHACSHGGLLEKGIQLLTSMTEVIGPRTEHYACIVDMLARAGLVKEALEFIEGLPVEPDVLMWQALLGGCAIRGNVEIGEKATEELLKCSPPNEAGPYVLLANIYSASGRWKERAVAIRRMKEIRGSKETGISWIEIEKGVHSFVVEDRMHPQGEEIYERLMELLGNMVDEGYVPDKRFVLHYVGPDGKS
ncbi:Pentatricopeptide repeat-containing protein At3g05340 [Linum grandiflorum]